MQVSAEVRLFWHREPVELRNWFLSSDAHNFPIDEESGAELREDDYLFDPRQTELGIKQRGGVQVGAEIKGLVDGHWCEVEIANEKFVVELWSKWRSEQLELQSTSRKFVKLEKKRWLRKFDTSNGINEVGQSVNASEGCNVELTRVSIMTPQNAPDVWWSFCLESFGAVGVVEKGIRETAKELCNRGLQLEHSFVLSSYPNWLTTCLSPQSSSTK